MCAGGSAEDFEVTLCGRMCGDGEGGEGEGGEGSGGAAAG